jgi:hypothetical protein
MARSLNNPDMPTLTYKYDITIIGDVPQIVWDTGKAMNALWNDLVERHDAYCTAFKTADRDVRKKVFGDLMKNGKGGILYERAKASKDTLDFRYYWSVWDRFRKARLFAKTRTGAPRIKHALERVLIPMEYGNFSEPTSWIHEHPNGRAHVRDAQGLTRGHFVVDDVRVPFEIVIDRPLPEGALIKSIALSGYHERPFGWKWSLIFSLQTPPHKAAPSVRRVAGLDLGWRTMGDYIRIGVIADSAGDLRELRLPYDLSRNQDRKFIARLKAQGCADLPLPRDTRAIANAQAEMDAKLEACKDALASVDRSEWPADAKQSMFGIVKMRAGGLRRIRRMLAEAGIVYSFLDEWQSEYTRNLRRYRAAQIDWIAARNYLYRCLAKWIAENYDALAWEGDLNLKQMAEQPRKNKQGRKKKHEETGEWDKRTPDDRVLEASQKHRQWASLHTFRKYLAEAMNKRRRDLQSHPAAYSSQVCDECGQHIAPGRELWRACADRHIEDQDISAALYYLRIAQGYLREAPGGSASVDHSQLLKVIKLLAAAA